MLVGDSSNTGKRSSYAGHMPSAKESIRRTVAENLKALMAHRKWTQIQLEAKSGISQSHISNIIREENDPSTAKLDAIASAFGIPAWLLMIPDLPIEVLDSPELPHLVDRYRRFAAGRS